jgi:hypothetical protein
MTNELAIPNDESTELAEPSDFGNEMAFLNPAEMPDLDSAEVGISIEPKYHEFVLGEAVRGIFNGIGHITKKNDNGDGYTNVPAIVFQTKDGVKLNAGASLVNQMRNIPPGTAVQITYSGQEKTGNGYKVNKFDVRLLNVPRMNVPVRPALPEKTSAPQYKNISHKNDYWRMVNELRMTNQEGNDHLREFSYDFAAAYEALLPGFIETV